MAALHLWTSSKIETFYPPSARHVPSVETQSFKTKSSPCTVRPLACRNSLSLIIMSLLKLSVKL